MSAVTIEAESPITMNYVHLPPIPCPRHHQPTAPNRPMVLSKAALETSPTALKLSPIAAPTRLKRIATRVSADGAACGMAVKAVLPGLAGRSATAAVGDELLCWSPGPPCAAKTGSLASPALGLRRWAEGFAGEYDGYCWPPCRSHQWGKKRDNGIASPSKDVVMELGRVSLAGVAATAAVQFGRMKNVLPEAQAVDDGR